MTSSQAAVLLAAVLATSHVATNEELQPTVMIVLLVRNKEHTLPYSLTCIQDLDYPKDRISLYIRSDHNMDDTGSVLRDWVDHVQLDYHSVNFSLSAKSLGQKPTKWDAERFSHLIRLKEEALNEARRMWADFVWFHDADAFVYNSETLNFLTSQGHTVQAPMLTSLGLYSNFWAGMTENYYYLRTDEYIPILERKKRGCYAVPMVHSSVLVNLRKEESQALTFLPKSVKSYDGPQDDIIVFALSARFSGVQLHICNEQNFGYIMVPLNEEDSLERDYPNLRNLKLEMTADRGVPSYDPFFEKYVPLPPEKDSLNLNKIYMINLERRNDRKVKMEYCLGELGIDYKWIKGVDGRAIDTQYLTNKGIKMMPEFSEPYHGRALTFGEIGCFMSHYNIWEDLVKNNHETVLILEDDIRFEPFFREKLQNLFQEIERLELDWDLIFLGRKILHNSNEPWVEGSKLLVDVGYTYWTLAYLLNIRGAKKLLEEKPLGKMVPVDEYLPIMYDRHPNTTWKSNFHKRNLKAYSVHPLLVHPTHYTGEDGYISDTEGTKTIDAEQSTAKEEL